MVEGIGEMVWIGIEDGLRRVGNRSSDDRERLMGVGLIWIGILMREMACILDRIIHG